MKVTSNKQKIEKLKVDNLKQQLKSIFTLELSLRSNVGQVINNKITHYLIRLSNGKLVTVRSEIITNILESLSFI